MPQNDTNIAGAHRHTQHRRRQHPQIISVLVLVTYSSPHPALRHPRRRHPRAQRTPSRSPDNPSSWPPPRVKSTSPRASSPPRSGYVPSPAPCRPHIDTNESNFKLTVFSGTPAPVSLRSPRVVVCMTPVSLCPFGVIVYAHDTALIIVTAAIWTSQTIFGAPPTDSPDPSSSSTPSSSHPQPRRQTSWPSSRPMYSPARPKSSPPTPACVRPLAVSSQ